MLGVFAVLLVAGPAGGALGTRVGGCTVTQSHSLNDLVKTTIVFVNKTAGPVKVYWLSYAGQRIYYGTLTPGERFTQITANTNVWLFLTSSGVCIGDVLVTTPNSVYVIGGSAAGPPSASPPANSNNAVQSVCVGSCSQDVSLS
jgi:von Hippel-Lindau disease tumor suppressor protein